MCLIDNALTRAWVTDRWLQGVNQSDPRTRIAFSDAMYVQSAAKNLELVQDEFEVALCEETIELESHDLTDWSSQSFYLTLLRRKPLIEVTSLRFYRGEVELYEVPQEWIIKPSLKLAQIQVRNDGRTRPSVNHQSLAFSDAGRYHPSAMRVSYQAGFREESIGTVTAASGSKTVTGTGFRSKVKLNDLVGFDGKDSAFVVGVTDTQLTVDRPWTESYSAQPLLRVRVPSVFLEYIGVLMAKDVLITAGDLVIGAGIASMSRNIDSLGQSINTTASAENSAYSARINDLKKIADGLVKTLRRHWEVPLTYAI